MFFAPNQRSVLPKGVEHVMLQFFQDQAAAFSRRGAINMTAVQVDEQVVDTPDEAAELACEEEVLNAFAPKI
jgi:hypothetical protein